MTTTKAANLWPPQHLDVALVKNNAPDNADVARTLAGNAAAVIGYTKGGAKLDDYTPNPAPRCPGHGLHGHDHSGGVYGYPLRRTIAHFDLGTGEERGSSDVDGNDQHSLVYFLLVATASVVNDEIHSDPGCSMWVPSGDNGPTGAYPVMGVCVVGVITTATNIQTGDSLAITIRNETTDSEITLTDSTVTAAGTFRAASTGTDDLMTFAVGRINTLRIKRTRFTATATVASRTMIGHVSSLEVGVYL
jgi:hypothetical protein